MVEGCSCKQGEGGPPWLERCAAGPRPAASCASNHRPTRPSGGRATGGSAYRVPPLTSDSGVMNSGHMKLSKPHRVILSACIALLASPPAIGAEIYKWVDAAGKTHYSENKKDAEAASGRKLEVKVLPPSSPSGDPRPSHSRSPEASVKPPAHARGHATPAAGEKPKPFSARDETDSGKCHLARSILNGSAKHSNMKPTDAYDRQVAESDVRIFCK